MALLDELFGMAALPAADPKRGLLFDLLQQAQGGLPTNPAIQKIMERATPPTPPQANGWEPMLSRVVDDRPMPGAPYAAPSAAPAPVAPSGAPAAAPTGAADFSPSFGERMRAFGMALQGQNPGDIDRAAEVRNQTFDFLTRRGMSAADAKTVIGHPQLLQAALPAVFGGARGQNQVAEIYDDQGRKQKVLLDTRTGKYQPLGGAMNPAADPTAATADIREYNLAKQQGFGGSFLDFTAAKKAAGKPPIESLTTAEKAVDKTYAKEYESLVLSGGLADAEKGIAQLREVSKALKDPNGDNLTGAILGRTPDFVTAFTHPQAIARRDAVEEVVQRNLRVILGAQFTQKEGERLIARAYNPALDEAENSKRVDRLLASMEKALNAKRAAADYYEQNGTMRGYKGAYQFSTDDLIADVEGGTVGAPADKPAPAAAPAAKAPADGARQAPDGNWYVPDPNRPGKYLRVKPAAAGGALY